MRFFWRHFRSGEKGFTLIGLLVVVALLGILAVAAIPNVSSFFGEGKEGAAVVPNVSSFIDESKEEAAATELHDVQLAMTTVMVKAGIDTVDEQTSWTNNFAGLPTVDGAALATDFDDYLFNTNTEFYYKWQADGTVRQDEDGL
ncbi:type II secretion system protein [Chloroflexota bacterium]